MGDCEDKYVVLYPLQHIQAEVPVNSFSLNFL